MTRGSAQRHRGFLGGGAASLATEASVAGSAGRVAVAWDSCDGDSPSTTVVGSGSTEGDGGTFLVPWVGEAGVGAQRRGAPEERVLGGVDVAGSGGVVGDPTDRLPMDPFREDAAEEPVPHRRHRPDFGSSGALHRGQSNEFPPVAVGSDFNGRVCTN